MRRLNRRKALKLGGITIAALVVRPAWAREDIKALFEEFSQGQPTVSDGLVLDIPLTAENGNAVPVTIRLKPDFSANATCEEIMLIAESNPHPAVCRFTFSPQIGMTDITTRIRLAKSQKVTALARLSDGRVLMQNLAVTVVAGGCNG